MNLKKRAAAIVSAGVLIAGLILGWYHLTGGFKISKIVFHRYSDTFYDHRFERGDGEFLARILQQRFRFLGKGCQVYAFASQDGKYVLKLLKLHRYKTPFRRKFSAFLKNFAVGQEGRIKKLQLQEKIRLASAFAGYQLAMDALKEEAALAYAHFDAEKKLPCKLLLKDSSGRKFALNPNRTFFLVQKKARNLKEELLGLRKLNKLREAEHIVDLSVEHLKRRLQSRIFDSDHSGYVRNLGLLGDRAISIDVGNFKQRKNATEEELEKEYLCCVRRLYNWACKNYPEISGYIQKKYLR